MNNNCELCGGKYDFRMVKIDKYLDMTEIVFSGSKRQVNNDNLFRFCPKCGRELTKEDFGGVDFGDKPDMREKIKEYISELDTEMKRVQRSMKTEDNRGYNISLAIVQTLQKVKDDLLKRIHE